MNTKEQVNKKYYNKYVEVLGNFDYSKGIWLYKILKTSKTEKENMSLGQDVGTPLEYSR